MEIQFGALSAVFGSSGAPSAVADLFNKPPIQPKPQPPKEESKPSKKAKKEEEEPQDDGEEVEVSKADKKKKKRKSKESDATPDADHETTHKSKKANKSKKRRNSEYEDIEEALKEENGDDGDDNEEEESDGDDNADDQADAEKTARKAEEDAAKLGRTVFVGNLPLGIKPREVKRLFSKVGAVESVRLRSVPLGTIGGGDDETRKRLVLQQNLHPNRSSLNAYVVFKSEGSCQPALSLNGTVVMAKANNDLSKHIRVDLATNATAHKNDFTIFVGNLPYDAEDEELWEFFSKCGDIEFVRVVRDKAINMGKGFCFVGFKESRGMNAALKMWGVLFRGRPIRVKRASEQEHSRSQAKKAAMAAQSGPQKPGAPRASRTWEGQHADTADTIKIKGQVTKAGVSKKEKVKKKQKQEEKEKKKVEKKIQKRKLATLDS